MVYINLSLTKVCHCAAIVVTDGLYSSIAHQTVPLCCQNCDWWFKFIYCSPNCATVLMVYINQLLTKPNHCATMAVTDGSCSFVLLAWPMFVGICSLKCSLFFMDSHFLLTKPYHCVFRPPRRRFLYLPWDFLNFILTLVFVTNCTCAQIVLYCWRFWIQTQGWLHNSRMCLSFKYHCATIDVIIKCLEVIIFSACCTTSIDCANY
jgi:hypothetical protein